MNNEISPKKTKPTLTLYSQEMAPEEIIVAWLKECGLIWNRPISPELGQVFLRHLAEFDSRQLALGCRDFIVMEDRFPCVASIAKYCELYQTA